MTLQEWLKVIMDDDRIVCGMTSHEFPDHIARLLETRQKPANDSLPKEPTKLKGIRADFIIIDDPIRDL